MKSKRGATYQVGVPFLGQSRALHLVSRKLGQHMTIVYLMRRIAAYGEKFVSGMGRMVVKLGLSDDASSKGQHTRQILTVIAATVASSALLVVHNDV